MAMKLLAGVLLIVGLVAGRLSAQPAASKAYILGQIDVTNPTQYAGYTKLTPALIEKFGGRFLARGGRSVSLEGAPARSRVVVVEFPSFDRAQQYFASPEYQAARKLRDGAAQVQFVLVEGQ